MVFFKIKYILYPIFFIVISSCNTDDCQETRQLQLQESSKHFDYYCNDHDEFILDTIWMEAHYMSIIGKLEIVPSENLSYHKYLDRKHLSERTGKTTNGFAELGTWKFHSIWHPDGHELIHSLVINEIGHPPALLNEGIAVALSAQPIYGFANYKAIPTWNGQHIDTLVSKFKIQNTIPDMSDLLESIKFFENTVDIGYPVAGSFCKYLLENYPLNWWKEWVAQLTFYTTTEVTSVTFKQIYNKEIDEVWNDWLLQL